MRLKLLDEYKARLSQFAPRDTTEADALAAFAADHPGWTEAEVKAHLENVIAAGAFAREGE